MRTILFFDLPVDTAKQRRNYRHFVKDLKKTGFFMLQESVYLKFTLDSKAAAKMVNTVKAFLPPEGNVATLTITEKQFQSIQFLLGESYSNVISGDERIIKL